VPPLELLVEVLADVLALLFAMPNIINGSMLVPVGKEKLGEKLSDFGTRRDAAPALPARADGEKVGESRVEWDIEPRPEKGKGDRV